MAGIEELVEQFKADATRTGAVVYEAESAADARDYVLKLAQERGVRHVVKSKSAVAEEIGLREYLENAGIEVKETDIGQWIAQLAGERADPVTDKTLEPVADLVSRDQRVLAQTGLKERHGPVVQFHVRAADTNRLDPNQDLALRQMRQRVSPQLEWPARFVKHHHA